MSPEFSQALQILLSFALLQAQGDDVKAYELLDDVRNCVETLLKPTASSSTTEAELPPLDLLVDVLLAYLEKGSAELRPFASHVFGLLSSEITSSAVEHIIAVSDDWGCVSHVLIRPCADNSYCHFH